MFNHLFPTKWRLALARQSYCPCQDQTTIAQGAEMALAKSSLTSCMWARFWIGSHIMDDNIVVWWGCVIMLMYYVDVLCWCIMLMCIGGVWWWWWWCVQDIEVEAGKLWTGKGQRVSPQDLLQTLTVSWNFYIRMTLTMSWIFTFGQRMVCLILTCWHWLWVELLAV